LHRKPQGSKPAGLPMPTTSPSDLLERLRWRYATRRFDTGRTIPADVWAALEEALVLTPSSYGLQPWKFMVVGDPALRQRLRALSWNQSQVTDASHLVVFLGLRTMTVADVDRLLQRQSSIQGTPIESLARYRQMLVDLIEKSWVAKDLANWNARQVYLALGQFMTAAALLGVDTCPMEGIDMSGYDRELAFEGTRYTTLCVCAAGYRAGDDRYATALKVRYDASEIVERR
jgi:nitroreductase